MADKKHFIATCGVPPMLVAACNGFGLQHPLHMIEENRLEHIRPDGWLISTEIFARHLDFLLPHRRHVLLYSASHISGNADKNPSFISLFDSEDRWYEALLSIQERGSAFGTESASASLSAREKDVLRLIAAGLTAKEIADRLGISSNTVVTHRKNLTAKLGIKSASGLSLYAMMNGLL